MHRDLKTANVILDDDLSPSCTQLRCAASLRCIFQTLQRQRVWKRPDRSIGLNWLLNPKNWISPGSQSGNLTSKKLGFGRNKMRIPPKTNWMDQGIVRSATLVLPSPWIERIWQLLDSIALSNISEMDAMWGRRLPGVVSQRKKRPWSSLNQLVT